MYIVTYHFYKGKEIPEHSLVFQPGELTRKLIKIRIIIILEFQPGELSRELLKIGIIIIILEFQPSELIK